MGAATKLAGSGVHKRIQPMLAHLITPNDLLTTNPDATAFMRARGTHATLTEWRSLEQISPWLILAVLQLEDPTFFVHRGFWWSQIRAEVDRARHAGEPVRGVSTISQQLARNLYLRPVRSMRRKLREAALTVRLERQLSKARILELYFNVIEWGDDIWGAERAAQHYCGCAAADLDMFEAVVLASLVPAPRQPLAGWNGARAIRAQKRAASLLYGIGVITRDDEAAVLEQIAGLSPVLARAIHLPEALRARDNWRTGYCVRTAPPSVYTVQAQRGYANRRGGYEHCLRTNAVWLRSISEWPTWFDSRELQEGISVTATLTNAREQSDVVNTPAKLTSHPVSDAP
jgi:membrane peptidoglycan carboxypeptidase